MIPRKTERHDFPMSFAQQRLWFLDRLQPGNPTYNVPWVSRLPGPVDIKLLERVLNEIVRRHESLRTTFGIVDRKPAQIIAPSLELKVSLVDLRSMPADAREAEAQRVTFEECRTAFDLTNGPLMRATLIELAPTDHVLVLVLHHIVSDGWSMSILYNELSALYGAYFSRRPSPLPELRIQYADFAAWQAEWFTGPVLGEQLDYWRRQLEGLKPLLALPIDRPRPPVQAHRGDLYPFSIEPRLADRVKALGQSSGATLFMTALAAFYVLLHRYTGETDLVVGSPIANRTRPELEGLIGFFVNTLVMRVDLSGDPTFRELLRRVRETALDAYAHQDMPFEKLVEELQPERNASHNPLFQVMFAVQNIGAPDRTQSSRAPQTSAPAPPAANGTSKFDLTLTMFDTGRGIDGAVEYNTDLFDPSTIAEIVERYEILLRSIAYDPDTAISRLPVARELPDIVCGPDIPVWPPDSLEGFNISPSDRIAHFPNPRSDTAAFEVFAASAAGATLVELPESLPPRVLAEKIREHEITVMFASAQTADRLAREFPWAFRTLRLVLCADGPAAIESLRESFRPEIADRVWGVFGGMDAGGYYAIQPLSELVSDELTIGRPVPGVTLHVVDGDGRPVPPGMAGEIAVERATGTIRTGEFARRLRDGSLAYLGRRDDRLTIRGVRIDASEIEATLRSHPEVRDAAVVAAKNGFAAFVVSASVPQWGAGAPLNTSITIVDAIPDRVTLRRRVRASERPHAAPRPYVAPRNDLEERIARIWIEIFSLDRAGIHDNFFEIGGHSLLATQVVARLHEELGVDLPLQRLFDAPTIAELAEIIAPLAGTREIVATPPLERVPRDQPLPLSFAQQRLWFLDQYEPESALYNITINVTVQPADVPYLRNSLNEIVRRHESLRTTFAASDGEPVQTIAPSLEVDLPVIDLRHLPPAERVAEAHRIATVEARTPFDLRTGPVMRATLLRAGESDHILLLTLHHIATDGWSVELFFRELNALNEAQRSGRAATLPELPFQYADFAAWQRRWLAGDVLEEQLSYWKRQMAGIPSMLELPTDRPRPPVQTFRGAVVPFYLPQHVEQSVKTLGEQERVTSFMTLIAALSLLFYRYTNQDDIVIGTPIANRTRPELEPLIGFFANTLAIRTRIGPDMTFRQLLAGVREVTLGAYAHQDIPYEKLVEELQPARSLSHNPIFQVMVALQNIGGPKSPGSGHPPLSVGTGIAKFDLTLFLTDTSDGIHAAFEYNTDLFDPATVERMAGHFETLLTAAVAEPDRKLATLPLMRPAEMLEIQDFSGAHAGEGAGASLNQMFEAQVERTPDAQATPSLTYRQLNERANALAHRLIGQGVGPDALVAISMPRSDDMIVAVLGVLKAGGGYVPIDPGYPRDRVKLITDDARVRAVLTEVDDLDPRADNPNIAVTPDNLAYVIYTSGSTGRPKGVAMPHRPLANLIEWQIARSAMPPGARTLQFASLSFDVSFQEIFSTLAAGGTLILIDERDRRDPAAVWALIRDARVNRLFIPYVGLQQLAEAAARIELPESLVEVITAGEQLQITPQIAALFARLCCPLFNQYGPTETHVVTEMKLDGDPMHWPARPPIGKPIPNAKIEILDPRGETVPVGVPGEIFVGGLALARGYLHQPELTRERFTGRLYRTGDRGRYLAGGNIEFLGRNDDQLKIRGFRVEPGEIEVALRRHPAVREAAVVARDGALVAYVQADDTPDLRAFLASSLPEYMIPARIIALPSLPLTPSGKLDRRALPEPGEVRRDEEIVAPRTPIESTIAAIWCDLLHLPHVSVRDNFFDLGGQSLLATRMVSRLNDELNVDLPLRRVFEQPTIEALAISLVEDDDRAAQWIDEIEAL